MKLRQEMLSKFVSVDGTVFRSCVFGRSPMFPINILNPISWLRCKQSFVVLCFLVTVQLNDSSAMGCDVVSFPPRELSIEFGSGKMGLRVYRVGLEEIFSEYSGFPCRSSNRLLHTQYHPSSRAGIRGQIVPEVPIGLSLTQAKEPTKRSEGSKFLRSSIGT